MTMEKNNGIAVYCNLPTDLQKIYLNQIMPSKPLQYTACEDLDSYVNKGRKMLMRLFELKNVKVLVYYFKKQPIAFVTAVIRKKDVSLYGLQVANTSNSSSHMLKLIDHAKVVFSGKRLFGLVHKDSGAVEFFISIGCKILDKCVYPEDHPEFTEESGYISIQHENSGCETRDRIRAITDRYSGTICTEIRPPGQSNCKPYRLFSAINHNNNFWDVNQVLTVSLFGNESDNLAQREEKIKDVLSNSWELHCNVKFEFLGNNNPSAIIRISFDPLVGLWSYLGRYCQSIKDGPTMNLINTETDVIIHVFGHALGLAHEHQSAKNCFKWNDDLYDYYKHNFGWSHDKVDEQIKNYIPIHESLINSSQSIMNYDFAAVGKSKQYFGDQLSDIDKKFAQTFYGAPKSADPTYLTLQAINNAVDRLDSFFATHFD